MLQAGLIKCWVVLDSMHSDYAEECSYSEQGGVVVSRTLVVLRKISVIESWVVMSCTNWEGAFFTKTFILIKKEKVFIKVFEALMVSIDSALSVSEYKNRPMNLSHCRH